MSFWNLLCTCHGYDFFFKFCLENYYSDGNETNGPIILKRVLNIYHQKSFTLFCSQDRRRATNVLQLTVFANRGPPFTPRECASYGIMEKQAQHTPLPFSHLHNTFTKSQIVGFVRGTCLCTSPEQFRSALWSTRVPREGSPGVYLSCFLPEF